MERLLLVWDEIDDLVGASRCLVARALMRMKPPVSGVEGIATLLLAGAALVRQMSLLRLR